MATQGLNFQTHQFNDPTEGLQKALGAGSMFAQSLKSMQDFESEQAKLRMMQQEKDRQARLDAEHAEDRAAVKKEIEDNNKLDDLLHTPIARADAGNIMMDQIAKSGNTDAFINADDSKFSGFNRQADPRLVIKEKLAKVDVSKLGEADKAEYESLLGVANGQELNAYGVREDGSKPKQTYDASTRYGLLKRAGMLAGESGSDAATSAGKYLGLTDKDIAGIDKSNSMANAFDTRMNEAAMNDPVMGWTRLQKIQEYARQGGTMTAAARALRDHAEKANIDTIAAHKAKIDELESKRSSEMTKQEQSLLDGQIDMLKTRMSMMDKSETTEDKIIRAMSRGGSEAASKLSREDKFAVATTKLLENYAVNSADPKVRQNIIASAEEAYKNGYSPEQLVYKVTGGIGLDGTPGEREKQAYKYDAAMFPKQAQKDTAGSNVDYASLRMAAKTSNDADKMAVMDQIDKLFLAKAKAGSSSLANLDAQLAEARRTPQQSFNIAASNVAKDMMTDYNIGGYADKEITRKLNESEKEKARIEKEFVSPAKKQVVGSAPGGLEVAKALIDEGEGTGYKIYKDFKMVDGKKTVRLATRGGIGIDMDDNINNSIKAYNKKNGTSIELLKDGDVPTGVQLDLINKAKDQHLARTYSAASKLTGDLGSDQKNAAITGAVTNMLWQYGDHSKPATKLAKSVIDSLKANDPNQAIKTIMNSAYKDFDERRAVAFASAIANTYEGVKVDPMSMLGSKDAKSAAKRYSSMYAQLQKSDLDEADRSYVLSRMQSKFADDGLKLNYRVDPLGMSANSSASQAMQSPTLKSMSNTESSLQQKLAQYQAEASDYRLANEKTKSYMHPIQLFGDLRGAWQAEDNAVRALKSIEYVNAAKELYKLKKSVAKIPSDISTIKGGASKKAEAQSKIDEYNSKLQDLIRYEANYGSNILGKSYMEENGIPLYSAEYKPR